MPGVQVEEKSPASCPDIVASLCRFDSGLPTQVRELRCPHFHNPLVSGSAACQPIPSAPAEADCLHFPQIPEGDIVGATASGASLTIWHAPLAGAGGERPSRHTHRTASLQASRRPRGWVVVMAVWVFVGVRLG